eukprot:TRINITY_DN58300_c0_g1_i1.p1 TRINITY_DN58300_c0_g1~~TRINITY_DN58300_c0_g1_i1.p1  ORF type:complete len:217 (-),score=46.58 TRINITY_DN58300_c0_g1_i1:238-807(-)
MDAKFSDKLDVVSWKRFGDDLDGAVKTLQSLVLSLRSDVEASLRKVESSAASLRDDVATSLDEHKAKIYAETCEAVVRLNGRLDATIRDVVDVRKGAASLTRAHDQACCRAMALEDRVQTVEEHGARVQEMYESNGIVMSAMDVLKSELRGLKARAAELETNASTHHDELGKWRSYCDLSEWVAFGANE